MRTCEVLPANGFDEEVSRSCMIGSVAKYVVGDVGESLFRAERVVFQSELVDLPWI